MEQDRDEDSEIAEEEERHGQRAKVEGDGAVHDSAFTVAWSTRGADRTGNGCPSIRSDQGFEREAGGTAGPSELRMERGTRRGSREVVFTTVHLLPRSAGEQLKSAASTFPRLQTRQLGHSRVSTEARKVREQGCTSLKAQNQFCLIVLVCLHFKKMMLLFRYMTVNMAFLSSLLILHLNVLF